MAYLLLGAFAGFMAGLFGVGGGAIMVPILTTIFIAEGFPKEKSSIWRSAPRWPGSSLPRFHLCVPIMRTVPCSGPWSVASPRYPAWHLRHLRCRAGACHRAGAVLRCLHVLRCGADAAQHQAEAASRAARTARLLGGRAGIGGISALVAIGGGTMSVPFMTWCNVKAQHAIGTRPRSGCRSRWQVRWATSRTAGDIRACPDGRLVSSICRAGAGSRGQHVDRTDRCEARAPASGGDTEAHLCRRPDAAGREDALERSIGCQQPVNMGLRFRGRQQPFPVISGIKEGEGGAQFRSVSGALSLKPPCPLLVPARDQRCAVANPGAAAPLRRPVVRRDDARQQALLQGFGSIQDAPFEQDFQYHGRGRPDATGQPFLPDTSRSRCG